MSSRTPAGDCSFQDDMLMLCRSVAANELLVYDALGLTEPGKAHTLAQNGDNTYGGKRVSPS